MKKFVLAVAACVAIGGVATTDSVFAAPKNEVVQQHGKQQEKEKQQNQGQIQQLKSIDKQLNNIEGKFKLYQSKIPKLSSSIEELQKETQNAQSTETTDAVVENEQVSELAEPQEETVATEEAPTEEVVVEEPVVDNEELDGNSEEEVESELKKYPGYEGKLNALLNRLNGVSNRLNGLSSKGAATEELQARIDRVEAMKVEIQKVKTTLTQIEKKVKEEVTQDTSAEEKESQTPVDTTKDWTIQFSKGIDISTLSNLDIVVLDEEQNLVETTISYLPDSNAVKISSSQPYESGKTYTLYIGNDISSESGLNLKNSVKMTFTVK
ncbi:Ig-like domain-containing protein [Ureibacillus xyleni]|uniref:Ig-like domain-containing protein n=1 Tax=Ureibacillus xyleni TaxID=614648 RepID=A0A285SDX4_9BACL|nr:Ig-like domain-containing protein [Ureibacillus xyleni]SOC06080.1 Ig-like domain-containing protein [Ureibacillus xyleni]